jgi:hypothetical protein
VERVARMGVERNAFRLVGKREGKWALGRPRHRLLDNIRMDLVLPYFLMPHFLTTLLTVFIIATRC